MTYFPPFRLREFNALSVPRCRGRRENDFIIHEMQSALGSLEKYRAISRKSKSRYRALVLNVACLRFTRGYSAGLGAFFGRIYGIPGEFVRGETFDALAFPQPRACEN